MPLPIRTGTRSARYHYCLAALAAGVAFSVALVSTVRAAAPRALTALVTSAVHHDTSAPLLSLAAQAGPAGGQSTDAVDRLLPNRVGDPLVLDALKAEGVDYLAVDDPVIQDALAPNAGSMPAPLHNFEGLGNVNGVSPPDPVGDIGYDPLTGKRYYMQWVNLSLAIWEIRPAGAQTQVLGPVNGTALFANFSAPGQPGHACATANSGDPIVLFDSEADRWFASQFALPNWFPNFQGPFYQCIAVSATADPTGAWHRYAFQTSATKMNDYPHFGVWPDGYYMSINQFNQGTLSWAGAGAWVFEREQMLAGLPARAVSFDLSTVNSLYGGQLPADLDGLQPPPPGSPNYFVEADMASIGLGEQEALRLWEFHVDWAAPQNSTFGLNGLPNATLPVSSFTYLPCVAANNRSCVQQPDIGIGLDAVGDRLMHRLAYRNFSTHEALVLNHTVNVLPGGSQAGVRWYELRDPGGSPVVHQQGTFAPDSQERWMASIAQDHTGSIALGYNVSGSSDFPSIRYTGRLAGDPLGQMTFGEATLIAGGGVQSSGLYRWGDYSSLTVDPEDDCTFWLTAEYIAAPTQSAWRTRIGSFRLPTCALGPRGTLSGLVTDADTAQPLGGALVTASAFPTQTATTFSSDSGAYAFSLAPGIYTVTAAHLGYTTANLTGLAVTVDATTTVDIPLVPAPTYTLSGLVTDADTGHPLWAALSLDGHPFDPLTTTAQTDPATGLYSLTVPGGGQAYTLTVTALQHLTATRALGVVSGDRVENFALTATTTAGAFAGYVTSDFLNGPVAGALVELAPGNSLTATSGADGYYQILQVPPGTYTATASAAGHTSHTVSAVSVPASAIARQDFTLTTGRAAFAPGVLSRTLAYDDSLTDPAGLVITNTGAGLLDYQLREQAVSFTPLGPASPQGGGPDTFGYTWRTSGEFDGPVFQWIDATGGTLLPLTGPNADDDAANLTLPFPFPYYSSTATALRVGSNGAIVFNSTSATLGSGNAALASTSARNLIAPFWDDLDGDLGGVYWQVLGAAPNRRVIIEWHARSHWQYLNTDGVGEATFEVVLYEDGDILFQYQDVDFGSAAYDAGASATVGLRGPGTPDFLQYSHNTPALADGLAICFDRPGTATACGLGDALPWITAAPLTGTLPGGLSATQTFSLTWSAAVSPVLPGQYRGSLWLDTSDPVAPRHLLPVTLTVLPPVVTFASAAQTVTERIEPVTVTVSLSDTAAFTVTVPFTVGGTAAATGSSLDHTLADGAFTFPPGVHTATTSFTARLDPWTEPDETILLTLGAPLNAALGPQTTHTITLLDYPLPLKQFFPHLYSASPP